ncbi:hypothetical protein QWZ06_10875 [Chryseobacterium tructae]|uniref:Uncharacterized protein n=1 Tax=Chryseobacterium tructae TaxID=1037380 RepID=A0ABV7XXY4_9FLAO|nr:hypothetical protein [Chryseobacterium tructae]MDN3692746.1 hypothetical protein [Chryseobacterium tructae]
MSYIDFNYEKNSILVCKGDSRNRSKITESYSANQYNVFDHENKFNGIEILNFLSSTEQDGLRGELRFKELLEKNNIPYLYIGQGPFGIERSGILLEKTKSKRADYLVNIKDMGTILFDVKCRKKIAFHNNEDTFFSIYITELEALNNLQNSILMPVWLAYIERDQLNENPKFHFISISSLMKFWSGLFDYYPDENEFNEISVLRIPNELFTKIEDKIIFEVGYKNIDEKLLNDFAKLNIGLNRLLKDKIKEIIRNTTCFKTKVYDELQLMKINFCFPNEVIFHTQKMIDLRIIEYSPKKPLRLFGE